MAVKHPQGKIRRLITE